MRAVPSLVTPDRRALAWEEFGSGPLARVQAPTLVITGELDPFGESANRDAWARAILDFLADD